MRTLYMMPTRGEAQNDTTNSINQIVLYLEAHLQAFGYELTDNPSRADLVVGHAGQGSQELVDIAHCHGLYPTAYPGAEGWHFAANRSVIQNLMSAKAITVPSSWVGEIIARDMHVKADIVPWAINPDDWPLSSPTGRPYVLWNKTRADWVCDPRHMMELAARARDMQFVSTFGTAADNIDVIGRQHYARMKELVQGAAVYLATTKETFGIGTLEAMASGVPVLGFNYGGTADIVEHGVTGFLAIPGDFDGLREGLDYCLKYRDVLGRNARQVALAYTWQRTAAQLASIYDRVLDAPKPDVKVSVVIPCYNYAQFVGQAIVSVLAQETTFNYEIIVVDDGSTDESHNIARVALGDFGAGRVYSRDNAGVAEARNYGIQEANGEYIVCLDADDVLGSPLFLQTLANALDTDRTLGVAFTGLRIMSEDGSLSDREWTWPNGYDYDDQVAGNNQVPTCCMFRREAWARAGGYRGRFTPAEDAEFWLRLGALGYRGRQVTKAQWFWYRTHSNSLSSTIRTGDRKEPDWREYAPYVIDNARPFAALGRPTPNPASWPVRNYDRPDVSIIVPCSPEHLRYLREALDSIEAQTVRRWEVIVILDGIEAVPAFLDTAYPFVRWLVYPDAHGAGFARNRGIDAARAPMVTFLDADDTFEVTFLAEMFKGWRKGGGRYVYSDWFSLNKEGSVELHETPEYQAADVFTKMSIHSINILIPRAWLHEINAFDESMVSWEDVDLFMKLASRGFCGVRVPFPLLQYRYATGTLREHGESIKAGLKTMLADRYQRWIEGEPIVCCGDGVKTIATEFVASMEAIMANKTDGDMVKIELLRPAAPVDIVGVATGQSYGRRQRGDVFNVWRDDFDVMNEDFKPFQETASVEETKTKTPKPPAELPKTPEPPPETPPDAFAAAAQVAVTDAPTLDSPPLGDAPAPEPVVVPDSTEAKIEDQLEGVQRPTRQNPRGGSRAK